MVCGTTSRLGTAADHGLTCTGFTEAKLLKWGSLRAGVQIFYLPTTPCLVCCSEVRASGDSAALSSISAAALSHYFAADLWDSHSTVLDEGSRISSWS